MNKTGILGDVLEEFETTARQAVKQVKGAPKQVAKTVAGQTGVSAQSPAAPTGDESNKDIVKALYGKSRPKDDRPLAENNEQPKTPEELEKLAKTRQDLQRQHKETYYDPLINRPKPKDEPVAEKIEKEEEEEKAKKMELIQKKEKKDISIAAQNAKTHVERLPNAG